MLTINYLANLGVVVVWRVEAPLRFSRNHPIDGVGEHLRNNGQFRPDCTA
jgi:hypothetical protein